MRAIFLALVLLVGCSHHTAHDGGHVASDHGGHRDHSGDAHDFGDPERWAGVWDAPDRDDWQQPASVIEAMEIEPGMTVVDIGAGTGYFNPHLSRAVGPEGRVYPVDVHAKLIEHMVDRAAREGTANVHPVLGEFDDPKIPEGEVDRVLIVNTYHHIDDRRAYFTRLRERLAAGGLLVNVDWKPGAFDKGPPPERRVHPHEVMAELTTAGFDLRDAPELQYQYVLVFEVAER